MGLASDVDWEVEAQMEGILLEDLEVGLGLNLNNSD